MTNILPADATFQDYAQRIAARLHAKKVDPKDLLDAVELAYVPIRNKTLSAGQRPDALIGLVQAVARAVLTKKNSEGRPVTNPRAAFWIADELARHNPGTEKEAAQIALNLTPWALTSPRRSDRLYAHEIASRIKELSPPSSQESHYADRILAWDPAPPQASEHSPLTQDHVAALCEHASRMALSQRASKGRSCRFAP